MQLTFASYSSAVAITPSNTTTLNCRAIYVGGTGTVVIQQGPIAGEETSVTFSAVPVGTILPLNLDQGLVLASSTATGLVALS